MSSGLPLFRSWVEAVVLGGVLLVVFLANVFIDYLDFKDFKSHKWATIRGSLTAIEQREAKNGRAFRRLYVRSDDGLRLAVAFFAKDELHVGMRVGFRVKSDEVAFADFLAKRFYAPSVLAWAVPAPRDTSLRARLLEGIGAQHSSQQMREIYGALFLAGPMSKSLRNDVQRFGIAHVVAISGFHLTIIFGFLYALLSPIYRFFQGRYFPYRNARWDISLVIFGILGWYLWLIDLTPSFLRAYLMGVVGFLFLWRGIKLLSFQTLALTAALIIALFPHLMFNIGFILSCAGVFFIFVFIRHFGRTLPLWADALLLNFWLFFAMLPLAHYWFGITSWMQFVSIPISILFVVFYPLAAFLHLIGWGGAMDGALMWMLAQPSAVWDVRTSAPMLGAYLLLALAAARWRAGFVPILALSLWYFAAV